MLLAISAADRERIRSNTEVLECVAEFHSARHWDMKSVWCACMTQDIDEEFFNNNHPWDDGGNRNLPSCTICVNTDEDHRKCCLTSYPNVEQWKELLLAQ